MDGVHTCVQPHVHMCTEREQIPTKQTRAELCYESRIKVTVFCHLNRIISWGSTLPSVAVSLHARLGISLSLPSLLNDFKEMKEPVAESCRASECQI